MATRYWDGKGPEGGDGGPQDEGPGRGRKGGPTRARGLEAHVFFYMSRQEKPTKYLSHKRAQTREVKMLLTVLVISSGTGALSGIGLIDKDSDTQNFHL